MKLHLLLRLCAVSLVTFMLVLFCSAAALAADTSRADYVVRNLTCGACVEKIQQALESAAGVGQVVIDVPTRMVRVAFDTEQTDAGELAMFLSGAGYPARLVEVISPGMAAAGGTHRAPLPAAAPGSGGCGGGCCKGKS